MEDENKTPLTSDAIKRITSAIARQNDGKIPKGSYAARLQSEYDKQIHEKGGE